MPSFARELEQTLHNALTAASSRRHEYATLEHLLLALIDDEHASKVMAACGVETGELKEAVRLYLDTELDALKVGSRYRSLADQRLPARRPARDPPRPVLGPRGGDRRQRARRAVQRARELCRLLPAAAGHEPPRCGQLHQPRRRQGRPTHGATRSERRRGRESRRSRTARRARARSSSSASISTTRRRTAASIR